MQWKHRLFPFENMKLDAISESLFGTGIHCAKQEIASNILWELFSLLYIFPVLSWLRNIYKLMLINIISFGSAFLDTIYIHVTSWYQIKKIGPWTFNGYFWIPVHSCTHKPTTSLLLGYYIRSICNPAPSVMLLILCVVSRMTAQ